MADWLYNDEEEVKSKLAEAKAELSALRSINATYDGIFKEQNAIFKKQLEEIERLRGATKGLLNVIHDYVDHDHRACLRFPGDGLRTCENTGIEPCEICFAKESLSSDGKGKG